SVAPAAATCIYTLSLHDALPIFQSRFRSKMLSMARDWKSIWPSPMGDQELVFHDKVMQTVNQPKWLPKDAEGLRFVANGEIGIIDRKSTRLNSSHVENSYALFCA